MMLRARLIVTASAMLRPGATAGVRDIVDETVDPIACPKAGVKDIDALKLDRKATILPITGETLIVTASAVAKPCLMAGLRLIDPEIAALRIAPTDNVGTSESDPASPLLRPAFRAGLRLIDTLMAELKPETRTAPTTARRLIDAAMPSDGPALSEDVSVMDPASGLEGPAFGTGTRVMDPATAPS